eukprot:TRINITY_DN18156_c0_g1_i1.p1 TRINITY_DN18156_c0_g1~~TRINITY_DN18156_c0_g1_i1.p1  ORF type:complete len:165 (-),score=54.30 TRINITY_DN18156_c0_g1_i1:28-498(-)
METTQIKPILKTSPTPPAAVSPRKHLTFDEENLVHNEETKSATMKIDEPPTPYHYYNQDDDKEEEANNQKTADENPQIQRQTSFSKIENSDLAQNWTSFQDSMEQLKENQSSHNGLSPRDHEKDESDFEAKRKQHYDEYKTLQKIRNEGQLEEEEK